MHQNMMDITGFGFDKPDKTMFQQVSFSSASPFAL